jgi:hypothetical protein
MSSTEKTICGFPPRLIAYIAGVVVLAAGALGVSAARVASAPPRMHEWLGIGLFLALALVADLHPVPLDDKGSQVSLAFVFLIAVLVIFGWQVAIPVAALSILLPMLVQGSPVLRAAFNSGAYAVAAAAAGATQLFGLIHDDVVRMSVFALVGGLIFVLVNASLVSGAVRSRKGSPIGRRSRPRSGIRAPRSRSWRSSPRWPRTSGRSGPGCSSFSPDRCSLSRSTSALRSVPGSRCTTR